MTPRPTTDSEVDSVFDAVFGHGLMGGMADPDMLREWVRESIEHARAIRSLSRSGEEARARWLAGIDPRDGTEAMTPDVLAAWLLANAALVQALGPFFAEGDSVVEKMAPSAN